MGKIIPIKMLSSESFKSFGKIIEKLENSPDVDNEKLFYWHDLFPDQVQGQPVVSYFLLNKRWYILDEMERHVENAEIFVPLYGSVYMVFSPTEDGSLNDQAPDIKNSVAFFLDGNNAFIPYCALIHIKKEEK